MRKLILAASALTLTVPVVLPSAAMAHRTGYSHSHRMQPQSYATYCRKRSGTAGLVLGGAAGALAGREIDGGRSRTTGTILGGAVGALLGRHVERNALSRRCR
jgi:outer membrane lipoprotein SlyB